MYRRVYVSGNPTDVHSKQKLDRDGYMIHGTLTRTAQQFVAQCLNVDRFLTLKLLL